VLKRGSNKAIDWPQIAKGMVHFDTQAVQVLMGLGSCVRHQVAYQQAAPSPERSCVHFCVRVLCVCVRAYAQGQMRKNSVVSKNLSVTVVRAVCACMDLHL